MSVIDQARELGISLANSPEFMRMKQAQAALSQDEAVSGLLLELNQKKQELLRMYPDQFLPLPQTLHPKHSPQDPEAGLLPEHPPQTAV